MQYVLASANIGRRGGFSAIGPGGASAAASPLSGYKFTASEGGLRVPLIIAWPCHAGIRAGGISDGLAHVTDILPTLTELAGVAGHGGRWQGRAVEPVTGRSLVPMLKGGARKSTRLNSSHQCASRMPSSACNNKDNVYMVL